ncbi:MAG: hypothetical protein ISP90_15765 [Nevskia sp.]|nr:hypothetical protein [Nevskia sp.]
MHWRALCGITLLVSAAPALAVGNLVDLEVYDATAGITLPVYRHGGRNYVAGEPAHEYRLALASHAGGRTLAVTSVDGVNVVSGETAAPGQTGYVLGAWQSYDILGWRKSLERVASFYFTSLGDSYAARTGRPRNVGVIGVAVFLEKLPYVPPAAMNSAPESGAARDEAARAGAAPAPMAKAQQPDSKLGTGHGRGRDSTVVDTEFDRASSRPDETIVVYYDSRANLVAQGIIPGVDARRGGLPNPFPNGFVPDP